MNLPEKHRRNQLTNWFKKGKEQNATHVIVVLNKTSNKVFPVYVAKNEDKNKVAKNKNSQKDRKVKVIYKL